MSKVLTVYEVADLLNVHRNTIYELVRQNKIKHIKIGRQIRIPEEYLDKFIEDKVIN
ncbi:helix-turn-helix domain-containing protein [Clostridium aestuarii]|uniref:Helix-turn-helix domain-containing protein n=1 Tax=Clostridium aestuarii TaxID=338193 RepID=A0ABT4D272_9CLOT|nr:helix-turn-helix domain-containing protein [Clostridium aestuarii]MCY6485339.1 helix-turn-helix domain-containing protein [Clostridium aestuarii]